MVKRLLQRISRVPRVSGDDTKLVGKLAGVVQAVSNFE
jgi:hypothetical protein